MVIRHGNTKVWRIKSFKDVYQFFYRAMHFSASVRPSVCDVNNNNNNTLIYIAPACRMTSEALGELVGEL